MFFPNNLKRNSESVISAPALCFPLRSFITQLLFVSGPALFSQLLSHGFTFSSPISSPECGVSAPSLGFQLLPHVSPQRFTKKLRVRDFSSCPVFPPKSFIILPARHGVLVLSQLATLTAQGHPPLAAQRPVRRTFLPANSLPGETFPPF